MVKSLEELFGEQSMELRKHMASVLPHAERDADLTLVINVLLYLANQDDVVTDSIGRQPWRAVPAPLGGGRKRKGGPMLTERQQRDQDLAPPQHFEVGTGYTQDLTRYLRNHEPPTGDNADAGAPAATKGSGTRSVRPHLRAPHWHLYWTGVGRTKPRLVFVPPVYVGGAHHEVPEAPASAVRNVR